MWQMCRVAALRRLARVHQSAAAAPSAAHTAAANAVSRFRQPPVPLRPWATAQAFSTAAAASTRSKSDQPLAVNGIALQDLVKRPRYELDKQFGAVTVKQATKQLPDVWAKLLQTSEDREAPPVSMHLAKQIFLAALKQKLPDLALRVFEYMDVAFPKQVDFVVYGEAFTLLSRSAKLEQIAAIYARNKPRYDEGGQHASELIYRFGVYAKLGQKDFAGVEALVDEMSRHGVRISNEIKSRIMVGYAAADENEKVLELYQSLDPQVGHWHEADVDRVVNSLGRIHCPDEAFEFYRNAQVKLSGNTLLTLIKACIENDRPKHAMAILANRKRFNLVLNTREYNKVLEALERFEQQKEIGAILDEMKDHGVRFDKLTKLIIARNQNFLQGTVYSSTAAGSEDGIKLSLKDSRRKMQEFNSAKAFAMAAGLADMHVTPLTSELDDISNHQVTQTHFVERAMTVPPSLATEAIVAYSNNGEHHKVRALVKGFSAVLGDFGSALTHIIAFYTKQGDDEMVYSAFKAVQYQGRNIFRVRDALDRFLQFGDIEAAMALFYQAIEQVAEARDVGGSSPSKLKKAIPFDRANLIKMTLQILIENRELDRVLEVFDHLTAQKIPVRTGDYSTVLRFMREEQTRPYHSRDFAEMWDDMARRGVSPNKAMFAHSCSAFFSTGKASFQKRLLDAYAQVKDLESDTYNLPPQCYSMLLDAAAKCGTLADVQALFDDAERSHQEAKKRNAKIKFYPRAWIATTVRKLAGAGDADAAFALVAKMPKHCGGYSYEAVVSAVRGCVAVGAGEPHLNELKRIFVEAKFRLSVMDAEELMGAAKQHASPQSALAVIQLFEHGNLKDAGDEKQQFRLANTPTAAVLAKLQQVYETAAALWTQHGDDAAMAAFLEARAQEISALREKE